MEKRFVYLAGPITYRTESEATDWRPMVTQLFHKNIIGISPLRGEPTLDVRGDDDRYNIQGKDKKFTTPKAIAAKNHYDTHNCDAVLAFLPKEYNDQHPSYGTIFELGWATGIQTPTILVTDDPSLHDHPLIEAKVNWVLPTFQEAADVINTLFDDYVREY